MRDFLQTKFEEQLEARKLKDGTIMIGSTPFTPVTILKSDMTAYENEFDIWRDEVWMPRQTEILQEVLETHANEKRFTDLCTAAKNGQLLPLIGSGVSGPTGLPTWSNLLRNLRPHSSLSTDALETHLERSEYEEAAEAIGSGMPKRLFDERIEHELRIDVPERICGAVCCLPTLFDRVVLTTNLDDIIEQVYTMQGQRFSTVLVGPNIREYRKVKAGSASILLKLHGDCRSREGRVLSKADYEAA